MSYVENPEQRAWMIADVAAVPGVRQVIVFSADGLLLASSEGMDRDSADRLAANCSGLQSLGRGAWHGSSARTADPCVSRWWSSTEDSCSCAVPGVPIWRW